ncbi:galactose-binding like protein, partial [Ramicandelaber brevisporus]
NNVNLANAKLGTRVIDVSNERLGRAERMLSPSASASVRQIAFDKTTGYADVDGWETSRHNKDEKDWVVLQLGFPGSITGIEIDTAGFGSSSAPEIMVEACQIAANTEYNAETAAWVTILPQVAVSANASTMFALWEETEHAYSHVRLSIFPDGAVARFRVFGTVRPTWPEVVSSEDADQSSDVDLAFVGNNARVVAWSNEAHGRAENLIMPERGANAGDGWLTSRSRAKSDKSQSIHSDWVAIRLGAPGFLDRVVVDTLHMGGTVPESCSIEACYSNAVNPMKDPLAVWHHVCARSNLSELDDSVDGSVREIPVVLKDRPFTHVRLTIYPDGGVKRFKVFGRR